MKTPTGPLNIHGKAAKGTVVLKGNDGEDLQEFGGKTVGNQASCYALTSLGDIITVHFALSPGVADFVDVVVDGILRESVSNARPDKLFKGSFKKVCQHDRFHRSDRRAAFKFSKMVVQNRSTQKGKSFQTV